VTTTNPQSWIKSTFFLWEFLYSSPESGENGSNSHWNRKRKFERLVFL